MGCLFALFAGFFPRLGLVDRLDHHGLRGPGLRQLHPPAARALLPPPDHARLRAGLGARGAPGNGRWLWVALAFVSSSSGTSGPGVPTETASRQTRRPMRVEPAGRRQATDIGCYEGSKPAHRPAGGVYPIAETSTSIYTVHICRCGVAGLGSPDRHDFPSLLWLAVSGWAFQTVTTVRLRRRRTHDHGRARDRRGRDAQAGIGFLTVVTTARSSDRPPSIAGRAGERSGAMSPA